MAGALGVPSVDFFGKPESVLVYEREKFPGTVPIPPIVREMPGKQPLFMDDFDVEGDEEE